MIRRPLAAMSIALLGACSPLEPTPIPASASPSLPMKGDLAVDIRETASLTLSGSDALDAALTLTKGYGVAPAGTELRGKGHVEDFPEAGSTLYSARFDAPADGAGPCHDQPVSLALSVFRRGNDAHVGGSLTAYCGKDVWHGLPARVLRLSGDLPLP